MEAEDGAGLPAHLVLVVGGQDEGHHGAGRAGRRFDHVRDVALAGSLVEVLEPLPRRLAVGPQVEVGAVGDPLELVPAPGEPELDVRGRRRIVGELVRAVMAKPQLRLGDAEVEVPAVTLVQPVPEPLVGVGWRDEVLHFHLFEFPSSEDEILRGDLVAKRLPDLGDAEGRPLPGGLEHVGEVGEHPLGRLRTQVGHRPLVLDRSGVGLEHQVEGTGLGELGRPAGRAHALDLVLPPPLVAVSAVDQWIGEVGQVTGGLPHRRRRQNGGIEAHHVVPSLHHGLPPGVLDVAQHVHAERPVVVGRNESLRRSRPTGR